MTDDPLLRAIDAAVDAIETRPSAHWVIAFSGGKDSSATLKIFLAAAQRVQARSLRMSLIYCDTGVENPVLDTYVKSLFRSLRVDFAEMGLKIDTRILTPPIQDRFFVRIIGRGYPPPTNSFRWCTPSLRIKPVSRFIETLALDETIVVLGLRKSESQQRDRSLNTTGNLHWQKQREGRGNYDLFLPIVELTTPEVWDAIFWLATPKSLDPAKLELIYRGASGECPIIRSPQSAPCASGRFGCWTCTVVRQDKSARELIRSGHVELQPFLDFRDWLAAFRNDPVHRWPARRNGGRGLGPFTIEARKEILRRINNLEDRTNSVVLTSEERGLIASLWNMDHFARLSFRPTTTVSLLSGANDHTVELM